MKFSISDLLIVLTVIAMAVALNAQASKPEFVSSGVNSENMYSSSVSYGFPFVYQVDYSRGSGGTYSLLFFANVIFWIGIAIIAIFIKRKATARFSSNTSSPP